MAPVFCMLLLLTQTNLQAETQNFRQILTTHIKKQKSKARIQFLNPLPIPLYKGIKKTAYIKQCQKMLSLFEAGYKTNKKSKKNLKNFLKNIKEEIKTNAKAEKDWIPPQTPEQLKLNHRILKHWDYKFLANLLQQADTTLPGILLDRDTPHCNTKKLLVPLTRPHVNEPKLCIFEYELKLTNHLKYSNG